MRRAISLVIRDADISNTWCAVVQSATTMIRAHSSVSVGAGSVCLFFFFFLQIPAPRAVRRAAGVGPSGPATGSVSERASAGQVPRGESSADGRSGCCGTVKSPVTRRRPYPPFPIGRPEPCARLAASALKSGWAGAGFTGSGVSRPAPAIGSGEQRDRPAGCSDRAKPVI